MPGFRFKPSLCSCTARFVPDLEENLSLNRLRAFVVFFVVIGIVSVSGGVAGAGFDPQPTGKGDGTLTIGQLAPQTGSLSSIVPSLTTPVTTAIDEINAAGGVFGQPVNYWSPMTATNPISPSGRWRRCSKAAGPTRSSVRRPRA